MAANINSPNPTIILRESAKSDMVLYSYPPVTPTVTFDLFDGVGGIGIAQDNTGQFHTQIGDDVNILVPGKDPYGNVFDPRFGGSGLLATWRVTQYAATVADEGQSTVEWTLAVPPSAAQPNLPAI